MAITIFRDVDSKFDAPIQAFMTDGVSKVAAAVGGPLKIALTLYILLYGIAILRGVVQSPVMDFAWRTVKLAFIVSLATKADSFNYYVTDLFYRTLPDQISNALAGRSAALGGNSFDALLESGFNAAYKIWEQAGWTDPGPAFISMMVLAASGAGTLTGYAVYLYAKIALALVIALGPIFIALAMFAPTRRLAEGWLGQVLNFVVLQVLVTSALLLLITVASELTASVRDGDIILTALLYCVIFGLTAIVAMQLPSIASALASGGAHLSVGLGAAAASASGSAVISSSRTASGSIANRIEGRMTRLQKRLGAG